MNFSSPNSRFSENGVQNKLTHFAKVGKFALELHRSKLDVGMDITIESTDGDRFVLHSLVAAAHSAFFRRLIQYRRLPFKISPDYSSDTIRQMIHFLYEGDVHPEMEQISELFRLTYRWEIRKLKKYLGALLCEFAQDSAFLLHCMNIAVSTEAGVGLATSRRIFKIAAKNLHLVLQDRRFPQLSALAIYKLLSDKNLPVGSELDVARILILYLGDRPDFYKHHHLWSTIHFENLSDGEAKELFERVKSVRDEKIRKIVLNSLANRRRITLKSPHRRSNPHLHKFLTLLEAQRLSTFKIFPERHRSRSSKSPHYSQQNALSQPNRQCAEQTNASVPLRKARLLKDRSTSSRRNLDEGETLRVSRFQRAKPLGGKTISKSGKSKGSRSIQHNQNLSLLNGDTQLFDELSDSASSESGKQSSVDARVVELEQQVPKVVLLSQQQQQKAGNSQECINRKMFSPASVYELQLTPDLLRNVGDSRVSDIQALPDPFGSKSGCVGGGAATMPVSPLRFARSPSQQLVNPSLFTRESLIELSNCPDPFNDPALSESESALLTLDLADSSPVSKNSRSRSSSGLRYSTSDDYFAKPLSRRKKSPLKRRDSESWDINNLPLVFVSSKTKNKKSKDISVEFGEEEAFKSPNKLPKRRDLGVFESPILYPKTMSETCVTVPTNESCYSLSEGGAYAHLRPSRYARTDASIAEFQEIPDMFLNNSLSSALTQDTIATNESCYSLSEGGAYAHLRPSRYARTDASIAEFQEIPDMFLNNSLSSALTQDTIATNESCYSLSEGGAYAHLRPSRYARTDASIAEFQEIPDMFLKDKENASTPSKSKDKLLLSSQQEKTGTISPSLNN